MLLSLENNMDEKGDTVNWGQVLYLAGLLDFVCTVWGDLGNAASAFHRSSQAFCFLQTNMFALCVLGAEIITIDRLEFEKLLCGNEKKAVGKKHHCWWLANEQALKMALQQNPRLMFFNSWLW